MSSPIEPCTHCGEPRKSLDTLIAEAMARTDAYLQPCEALAACETFRVATTIAPAVRSALRQLRAELKAAPAIAASSECGPCMIARNPGACYACWVVALWGVDNKDLAAELERRRTQTKG